MKTPNLFVGRHGWRVLVCVLLLFSIFSLVGSSALQAADAVDAGYRTFSFGSTCNSTPTGEKPESKLWIHDGYWWGSLCNGSANEYHIYRLDLSTQDWIDTQTVLDDRPSSKADVLWDAASQKLYVVSHVFTTSGASTSSSSDWGRLYRYSYNAGNKTYVLDSGFPVNVTRGKSETLTIAKDATGQLWVTYVEGGKVMVNHSRNGNDADWGTPYQLPVNGSNVSSDDISAIIAYENYIGIMWSNQSAKIMYFARHDSNNADDQSWQSVSAYNPGGSGADDHINLKTLQSDSAGRIFAVTKTSFSSATDPLILLLVCSGPPCTSPNQWSAHLVYTEGNGDTRPILLIDTDHRELHVFTTNTGSGGEIRHKTSSLDSISFPAGEGDLFIGQSGDNKINNPTSTKQNVNAASGIVVLASSQTTDYYYHNYIDLGGGSGGGGGPTNQPPVVSAGPDQAVTLPAAATLSGVASDDGLPNPPASLITTWSQQSGPGSVTFANANSANTSASFTQAGTYVLRLTANDGSLTSFDEATITVNDASGGGGGSALTFAAVADTLVKSSSATSNYGADSVLRLRGGSEPLYNSYLQFNVSGLSGAVQSAKLRLYVTDGSDVGGAVYAVSNNGSDNAPWTEGGVTWANAPVISGGPLTTLGAINADQWAEYDVTAAISGNGLFSFGLNTSSSNSAYFSSKEGANPPQLVITVDSGSGGGPTNQPPTVNAGADQTITLPSGATLAGVVNDDGVSGALTQSWSQVSGPATASFANANQLDTAVTLPAAGAYVLRLTANDGEYTISDDVTITVNAAPGGGSSGELTFTAAADALVKSSSATRNYGAYNYLRLRGGNQPLYNSYVQFNVAGVSGAVQSAKLRLYVTDGSDVGGSVYAVSNNGSNGAPWSESGITWANAPIIGGSSLDTLGAVNSDQWVEYNVTAAITGNGLVSFALDTTSSNSLLFSSKEGAHAPELIVIYGDGTGGGSGGSGPTNQPPTANAGVNQTITLPSSAVLNGSATDDGLPNPPNALTYAWSKQSGPGGVTFGDVSNPSTTASFAQAGTYTLRLMASDSQLSGFADVIITVNAASGGGSGSGSGVQTLTAVADAMVKSSSATRNYGSVSTIRLRDTDPFYTSYLQFNVTGVSGPVQSAKLRLYVTDASNDGGAIYLVSNNGSNGAPWTESGITWENAPVIGGSPLSTLGAVESEVWVEFDVTAAVAGNGLLSFGLNTASTNSVLYSSKEGVHAPELVVTYGAAAQQATATQDEQSAHRTPSIDRSEALLDARLVQELQMLDGGVMLFLPLAERP
ncbi:MAG: PKD domain-containing protein [Caldilineaceae bacterium]|nr:PKD domain-containing protein [Caldilineaceae bacterium]